MSVIVLACSIALLPVEAAAQVPMSMPASVNPYENETREQRNARMAWFREARFGMFIHWGVYAVPQGEYEGKRNGGLGEWLMWIAKIPVAKYKAYAPQFTASKYDPDAWAALAHEAGMRYIVITSKHHDGFALYDSEVSDWDAVNASGAKRDLIAPLAKATRERGMKFGLYYSQSQDWVHPGGGKMNKQEGEGWDDAHKGDFDTYLRDFAAPQVREILTNYKPDILWWDTPVWMDKGRPIDRERANHLIPLISLVPGIITNDRLGGGYGGDTTTPEQNIPAIGYKDRDWEVCMTMNDTWGFKSYDHNWKSSADLIRKLCDIVSKGGNFLLNVGPTAEGVIPPESVERLKDIGAWMKVNSEAIYGTTAGPFRRLPWGRCTRKTDGDRTTLYLHVFDWPVDGRLRVLGLHSVPESITSLAGGNSLSAARDGNDLVISLPDESPDSIVSVIKLQFASPLEVDAVTLKQDDQGVVTLTPPMAEIGSHEHGSPVATGEFIRDWNNTRATVQWTFKINQPGAFAVIADAAGHGSTRLRLDLNGVKSAAAEVDIALSGSLDAYQPTELGRITVGESGVHTLTLRPSREKDAWKPMQLRGIRLVPMK